MSDNLKKAIEILKIVSSIKKNKLRKEVLSDLSCNECVYKGLREIALNIIKKNVPLTLKQKVKLRPYKTLLQDLALKKAGKLKKKKLVIQSGGALPILIPAVISIVGELLRNGLLSKS